jgi:putative phage-type endonuclease
MNDKQFEAEILIDKKYSLLNGIVDRIFGFSNFADLIECYTIQQIADLMNKYYLKIDENEVLIDLEDIKKYLMSRKYWTNNLRVFDERTTGGEQHSIEWFRERNKRITASSVSTVLGNKNTITYKKLLLEKLSPQQTPRFLGSVATQHGTMFEPVAREIYMVHYNVNVKEYGLIQHTKYNFIGASPDGISDSGVLLEIKCPLSRNITNKIPKKYYEQIQHQLETCDYEICHYGEFVFKVIENQEYWWNSFKYDKKTHRGIVIAIKHMNGNGLFEFDYIYSDIYDSENIDEKKIVEWIKKETVKIYGRENKKYGEIIEIEQKWWILENFNIKRVERDLIWFEKAFPKMEEFNNIRLKYLAMKNPIEQFCKDYNYDINKDSVGKSIVPDKCLF